MTDDRIEAPDPTAVRVALWRAVHVQVDAQPHILEDEIGLELVAPDDRWRDRPDMHPEGTRGYRASIVARARYVEDLAVEEAARGVTQYVLLGAGLDTFAQRRPDAASRLEVFEVDQPNVQRWKTSGWPSRSNAMLARVTRPAPPASYRGLRRDKRRTKALS